MNDLIGTCLSPRTFWVLWLACLAAWVAAMAVAAPWDLRLSIAVADRSDLFGRIVAIYGEVPGWIAVVASVVLLIMGRKEGSALRPYRPLAWAVLLLALIQALVITQAFKFLWGRVRFRDLGLDFLGFTPFYLPAGPGAGLSFPSGHVAMASVFAPVVFFLARLKGTPAALIALVPVLAFSLAVAWGRILAGAHYLTDCVFSTGLSFLLAALLIRRLARSSRNGSA